MTPIDLIKLAAKAAGTLAVGQTMLAEDANDILSLLNALLAQWNQNRWMVYHLVDVQATSTGAASYTVGTGGSFNVARPAKIESAYARFTQVIPANTGPLDYTLNEIETYEEYGSVRLKSLQSWPVYYFYDPIMPLGKIYFWPVPSTQFELHLILKETLPSSLALTDTINLPPEYQEALIWNLAGRIQLFYNLSVNPGIVALAEASLATIKSANARIPVLSMPAGLSDRGGWSGHGTGGIVDGSFTLNQSLLG